MPFEAKGVRSEYSGQSLAIARSERYFTRFGEAPIEPEALGTFATLGVEVGDLVLFSSRRAKDPKTGEPGVGPLTVQVLGKSMDFEASAMRFRMQYAFANFRYGRIPPTTVPNYASAEPAQKSTYIFMADGDPPLLPGGDEPYRWG
jgi:hypothetical protein